MQGKRYGWESELADIPLKPPMRPTNEDYLDQWEAKCYEWKVEKGKRESALAQASRDYLSALFDAVAEQVDGYFSDHMALFHKPPKSLPDDKL
jgi:hypothetical protein